MTVTPPSLDFYNILGIHRDVSLNDIKIAYRRTLLRHHPDKQTRSRCSHEPRMTTASTFTGIEDEGDTAVGEGISYHPIQSLTSSVVSARPLVADMALVKEAYETLSDARLRVVYDRSLKRSELDARPQPRPAQVVSLEEFTMVDVPVRSRGVVETVRGATRLPPGSEWDPGTRMEELAEASAVRQEWYHHCRCGGTYRLTEDDLENGSHLVGCESCSEVVWVGYEEVVTEDEEASLSPGIQPHPDDAA